MKGFNPDEEGPRGVLYKKVNQAVAQAMIAESKEQLIKLLGNPDKIIQVPEAERICEDTQLVDLNYPEFYWDYLDPYRPNKLYRFGISGDIIVEKSNVSNAL